MPCDHHVTLAGTKWLLRFTRLRGMAAGWAYVPDARNPKLDRKILIDERLRGRSKLETIIHECLHVCPAGPAIDESHVTESARDIARVLWALGYRDTE